MKRRPSQLLSEEDRILWNRVARTAVPLAGKAWEPETAREELRSSVADMRDTNDLPVSGPGSAARAGRSPQPAPRSLDRPVRQKLSRGRLPIEATVDLHGMTQQEAHGLLLSFLGRAYAGGLRHVLVITGKGRSGDGDGVLRRSAPQWFATPPFRMLVSGFDEAARGHGGGGALYVRLRRQRGGTR